jgi:hypothetical protein
LEELRQLEKRQKLVQFEKRVRFLICSKAAKRKRKKKPEAKSGGSCGNRKRFGRFIGNEI